MGSHIGGRRGILKGGMLGKRGGQHLASVRHELVHYGRKLADLRECLEGYCWKGLVDLENIWVDGG